MLRSTAANRSSFQFSESFSTVLSLASTAATAPSNNSLANLRVESAARACFQKCCSTRAGLRRVISHSKSICSANSRDLRRSVMLTAPPATRSTFRATPRCRTGLAGNLAHQLRHLHRRKARLVTFITRLEPSAIDRLLQRVAGQDAENQWHAGIELRQLNTPRCFRHHNVVVRSLTAQNATNTNDGIKAP